MLSSIRKWFSNVRPLSDREYVERYLAQSRDLVDLEYRERELMAKGYLR